MNDDQPWRIIVVVEGRGDERRVPLLIDHFLTSTAALPPLTDVRTYEGLGGWPFIRVHNIPQLARERGLSRRFSSDGPKKGDGGLVRQLFQVLQKEKLLGPRSVVVWSRDDDGVRGRRTDVENALGELPTSNPWLLAIASECGEAWVIAGWSPASKMDDERLRKWRQQLGFAPHEHPECLSHKENVPKSAKAVLDDFFGGDRDRENESLIAAACSGSGAAKACGLSGFCDQLRAWIARDIPIRRA